MSLIPQQIKIKKTEDIQAYHKQYRRSNVEHLRNLDKNKYYKKKYNLDDEFITKFGEYSGSIWKILIEYNDIKTKCPSLEMHIIELFKSS